MEQLDLSAMDHAAKDDLIRISSRGDRATEVTHYRTRSPPAKDIAPSKPPSLDGLSKLAPQSLRQMPHKVASLFSALCCPLRHVGYLRTGLIMAHC